MMTYLEMVFDPVLLCMGLFAVFGLATIQGFRVMSYNYGIFLSDFEEDLGQTVLSADIVTFHMQNAKLLVTPKIRKDAKEDALEELARLEKAVSAMRHKVMAFNP